MATLQRIRVYPVKSLDPLERERARIVTNGGLAGDREFALFDAEGRYVNGKRTAAVHRLRSVFDPDERTLRLDADGCDSDAFALDDSRDREALTAWLSTYFDESIDLRRNRDGGFPDDTDASGPTVVSTATLREVASWFPGIGENGMRRRLRANLELGGVPAFWEDRLFADHAHEVAFEIGGVRIRGVNPCQRCVVPTRDPATGEAYPEFRKTFVEKRRETMPDWSDGDWFDHHFRLMVNTRVPASEWDAELAVGDEVTIVGRERKSAE